MNNSIDYSVAELSENAFFVQILSNYPNMFQRPITKSERARQEYARYALTHTFNEKCKTNLTIKQISRKINNMKSRLKDKNTRQMLGGKPVKYHDWEKLFLKMWTGSDTFPLQSNETENMERKSQCTFNPEHLTDKTSDFCIQTNKQPTVNSYSDFESTNEPTFNNSKTEDDIGSVSDVSPAPYWKIEPENLEDQNSGPEIMEPLSGGQFYGTNNKDYEEYEKMSMEELQRISLINQTKMFKAQEAAARSKETLNLYKLMILRQTNERSFQN